MLWHRSDICCAVKSEVNNFHIIIFKLQVHFKPNHLLTCYLGRKRKGGTSNHDTHKPTDLLLLTDRFLHKIFCAEEVTRTCQVEATTSFFVDEVRGVDVLHLASDRFLEFRRMWFASVATRIALAPCPKLSEYETIVHVLHAEYLKTLHFQNCTLQHIITFPSLYLS